MKVRDMPRGRADRRWSRPAAGSSSSSSSSAARSSSAGPGRRGLGGSKRATPRSRSRGRSPDPWLRSASSSCTSRSWPSPTTTSANHTNVTLAQDDTQLTPSLAVTKRQSILPPTRWRRSAPRAARRSRRWGRSSVGRDRVHLRFRHVAGADHGWQEPDVPPRRPQRQHPGPAGRQLRGQALQPKGRAVIDDDEAYSQGLVKTWSRSSRRPGSRSTTDDQRDGYGCDARGRDQVAGHVEADPGWGDVLPWQAAANAQTFGLAAKQRARRRSCLGPTAPTRRRSSRSRGATCRPSGPTSRARTIRWTS